ncbi:MAG TPA: TatD family hydrolase [Candidatus Alistipes merdavium]|nr:TatD family hydrolase [Candidatus Alistipes merdavium]
MNLTDTHSHLYEPEFDADREEALARAFDAGVGLLLLPAIDAASDERLFALCRHRPDRCLPMMGLHPTSVNDNPRWREELDRVARYLDNPPEGVPPFCAVGEIGLDYYWDDRFAAEQIEAFTAQCRLAAARNLPVAIHTRAAWNDMRRIVGQEAEAARARGERLRGVFHAFSEDADTYRALRGAGDFLFGIGGVVTFKKSKVAETVREMVLDEIVLETDCPYLTPVPHRGERNESAYVRLVCEKIAQIKGLDPEEVAAATTANAARMFGLSAGSTSAPAAGTAQTTARDDVSNSRRATDYEPTDTPQP